MYLWSGTLSVFSAKVRIAAKEKGLALELRELPWSRTAGWSKSAEFLAVSPRGQVPVLVDGDLAVFDSTTINQYLDERYPEPALMPADPAARARCRMWEDLADDLLAQALPVLVRENFLKRDPAACDAVALDAAQTSLAAHHRRLDETLRGQDYLCGTFGLADIANYLLVAFGRMLGTPPDPALAALAGWLDRVGTRPAVKAELDAIAQAAAAA
ncbi:MAG TPA: glutathione S-transferase family protein [Pseudomonadales bacterium]